MIILKFLRLVWWLGLLNVKKLIIINETLYYQNSSYLLKINLEMEWYEYRKCDVPRQLFRYQRSKHTNTFVSHKKILTSLVTLWPIADLRNSRFPVFLLFRCGIYAFSCVLDSLIQFSSLRWYKNEERRTFKFGTGTYGLGDLIFITVCANLTVLKNKRRHEKNPVWYFSTDNDALPRLVIYYYLILYWCVVILRVVFHTFYLFFLSRIIW